MHGDTRVIAHEAGQERAHVHMQKRHRASEPDHPAGLRPHAVDGLLGGVRLHQHGLAVLVVGVPGLGGREMAGGTVDQAHAEPLFQGRHPATQFGFGHADGAPGRREAAVLHGLREVIEVVQVFHCPAIIVPIMEQSVAF